MFWKRKSENDFVSRRQDMVEYQLRRRGIRDARVLEAMLRVPREEFLPEALADSAYDDRALAIECGQTISQPYIVAYMTEQLDIRPDHRVLEIGTGTGYQTAILAGLCRQVYSIERVPELSDSARPRLAAMGITNATLLVGDGTRGLPEHAPFERIIVTAASPQVPQALADQLVEEGVLVLPVGGAVDQVIVRVTRSHGRTVETDLIGCRFVKLIGEQGWTPD